MNSEQREKYSRQILFPGIGSGGQQNLVAASAVLVGCGALGHGSCEFARAGGTRAPAYRRP